HPETLRFFLLTTSYGRPTDYSEERLEEIRRSLEGFYRFFERYQRIADQSFYVLKAPDKRAPFDFRGTSGEFLEAVLRHRSAFLDSMDDDFNTGAAIGVLHELLTTLNRFADVRGLESSSPDQADVADFRRGVEVLKELSQILGIFLKPVAAAHSTQD